MSAPYVYTPAAYELPPYYTHPHTPQRSPFIPPRHEFSPSPYTPPSSYALFPGTPQAPYHSNISGTSYTPYHANLPGTQNIPYYADGYSRSRRPSWHAGMARGSAPPSPSLLGVSLSSSHTRRHSFGHHSHHSPWPSHAQSQRFQIHPLLNGEAHQPDFHFDIANPAFAPLRSAGLNHTVMVMVPVDELREPAMFPPITSMRITHDIIPQWPIDLAFVHGEYEYAAPPLPITVGDVLWMIHSALHRQITHQDWARLSHSEETAVAQAYTRRYRSIPSAAELEASQGVKRVDYLMGRHVFRGIVRAPLDPDHNEDGHCNRWRLLT